MSVNKKNARGDLQEEYDIYLELLRELISRRKALNITQSEVAKRCKASESHIGAIERGKYVASADLILRYEQVVGVGFGGKSVLGTINPELASMICELDESKQRRLATIVRAAFFEEVPSVKKKAKKASK